MSYTSIKFCRGEMNDESQPLYDCGLQLLKRGKLLPLLLRATGHIIFIKYYWMFKTNLS